MINARRGHPADGSDALDVAGHVIEPIAKPAEDALRGRDVDLLHAAHEHNTLVVDLGPVRGKLAGVESEAGDLDVMIAEGDVGDHAADPVIEVRQVAVARIKSPDHVKGLRADEGALLGERGNA
jgi:hypothetical protein